MSLKSCIDDLHKYRNLVLVVFVFCMVATMSFLGMYGMQRSSAAAVQGFNPGNIISDAVMGNYNSMSKDDIQRFLTSKNSCNNTNYNQYLSLKAQYPNNDWHFENGHFVCLSEERFGDGTTIGQGQTAAEIIYQAAQDYRINPQVILVLLEKEQSLITDNYPNAKQYRSATGYGCPDTAACSTKYYGFKNQVRNAAALFRDVLDNGYWAYPEKTRGVYVGYNPNSACGRSEVYIENRATSALYRYTPYQPNAAALAAGYGTGDGCSAYGNRNFYLYFTNWFGSTQAAVSGEPAYLPEGNYFITSSLNDGMALSTRSDTSGVNLTLNQRDSYAAFFNFQRDTSSGYYKITNTTTGKVLSLSSSSAAEETNIQLASYSPGLCSQQWKVYRTTDGYVSFESACSPGLVLSLHGGSAREGANIDLHLANNSAAQKWRIFVGRTITDGIYSIQSASSSQAIAGITWNGKANGTNVQINQDDKLALRKWQFTYNSNGYYTITDISTGKVLDLSNSRVNNGSNVQVWDYYNQTCAQKWKVANNGDGTYSIFSACAELKALDLSNGNTAGGTNIQIWDYYPTTSAQRWRLQANPVLEDGEYAIYSLVGQNKALDLSDAKTANGTNIQIWDYYPTTSAQRWLIERDKSTGLYYIKNAGNNKSLDLSNSRTVNTNNIQLWDFYSTTCAQKWQIVETANQTYSIQSSCRLNYALDVTDSNSRNGTNVWIYESYNTNAQRWTLKRVK